MNNFDLDAQAKTLADSNSGYRLGKMVIERDIQIAQLQHYLELAHQEIELRDGKIAELARIIDEVVYKESE